MKKQTLTDLLAVVKLQTIKDSSFAISVRNYFGCPVIVNSANLDLIKHVCKFIDSISCKCSYTEYWVIDMEIGRVIPQTEMGAEMKDIKTIEQFVEFLFTKYDLQSN